MDTDARPATAPATMTLAELAAFLAVSPQALYDLRSKGRGPRGFRVGRHLRFRAAEIEAWIRAREDAHASVTSPAIIASRMRVLLTGSPSTSTSGAMRSS